MVLCRAIDDLTDKERVLVLGTGAVGERGWLLWAEIIGLGLDVSGLVRSTVWASGKQPTIVLYTVSKGR
jgi:glycine cleavage system aminomethyltransferase T